MQYGATVKVVARSGGDVFKFAGDAMIALWPPSSDGGDTAIKDVGLLVHRAAQV